ncbi:hypothetical protein WUBG_11239 [Wuchereria bancrofti]|uniref:Uncharacterized protein n=1 Tax=Wuchereria bancrofti TaxID=6293 RepID=J9ERE9_WUCBA|nr:hypothetical protein WUBG_11239 [Wuchereria bancrofti]
MNRSSSSGGGGGRHHRGRHRHFHYHPHGKCSFINVTRRALTTKQRL